MTRGYRLWACVTGMIWIAAIAAQGADFAVRPTVESGRDGVVVRFAADAPCDVAVSILNADGKAVRHLAGGMLGAQAPAPFKPGSLAQALTWDRRDDEGRLVPAGRYTVRVDLGLKPVLDKVFSQNVGTFGTVHGLAVRPNGDLYVLSEEGRDSRDAVIRVLARDGSYRRTILPRPADIPVERAVPLGELILGDNERFPTCQIPQYGGRRCVAPVVTADGDLVLANNVQLGHVEGKRFRSVNFIGWNGEKAVHEAVPRRLLRVAADGGAPEAGCLGPILKPGFDSAMLCLAEGPDGQIYVSGARHTVFRTTWDAKAKPEPFVGTPGKAGDGPNGLRSPEGIAFDTKGRLFVADKGNHRVAIFDRQGKLSGELAVEWPRKVLVSRDGTVYVAAGHRAVRLLKYVSPNAGKATAEFPLGSSWPVLALDDGAKRAVIYAYVKADSPGVRAGSLVKLVDAGDTFQPERVLSGPGRARQPLLAGVDRERELLYGVWPWNRYWRMDGRSGRVEEFDILLDPKANGTSEITCSPKGNVIVHVNGEIGRLGPDLAPLPFEAIGSFIVSGLKEDALRSMYAKDCCEAPNGDIFRIHERGGYTKPFLVSEIKADGSPGRDSLVVLESASAGGIRVDRKGCIYVLEHLKPIGKPVPPDFVGKTPGGKLDSHVEHYGSLLKFRPEGGRVRKLPAKGVGNKPDEVRFMVGVGRKEFAASGLEWSRYGVSILRSWHASSGCKCWTPRFDLDDFGRVFVPDQLRCRILVLDANGNLVTTFGRYGNVDDKGPGIPLADPRTVMVSREAAYVGDMSNQQVVRVRLDTEARADCVVTIKAPAAVAAAPEKGQAGDSEASRAAAMLRLSSPSAGEDAVARLKKALDDPSELVRVAAAYALTRRGDYSGAACLLEGVRSPNRDVFILAQTGVLKELVRRDSSNPLAMAVDPRTPLVPRFTVGKAEQKALLALVGSKSWYLNRAAIILLGQSGSADVARVLLARLDEFKDRNLNRAIGALGALRCREAVPALVGFVKRGRDKRYGSEAYNGDHAEQYAARALSRIGDPACVAPLIALLDSQKRDVREPARDALSNLMAPGLASDRRLLPRDGVLQVVRIDELPEPGAYRKAWEGFWTQAANRYAWNPDSSKPLER